MSAILSVQHSLQSDEWPTAIYGIRLTNTTSSTCTIPAEPGLIVILGDGSTRDIKYSAGNSTPDRAITIGPDQSASTTITAINGCAAPAGASGKVSSVRITLGSGQVVTIANWNQEIDCGLSAKPFNGNS